MRYQNLLGLPVAAALFSGAMGVAMAAVPGQTAISAQPAATQAQTVAGRHVLQLADRERGERGGRDDHGDRGDRGDRHDHSRG